MPKKLPSSSIALHHLRYSLVAADHGSFRRAAEALLIEQSTLSRTVRELEDTIGVRLFNRSSGGVKATPIGELFLKTARSILIQIDELIEISHKKQRSLNDRLIVGFYTSLSAGNLRATLVDFKHRFPATQYRMVERSGENLSLALRNGSVDIAIFAGEAPIVDIEVLPLWSERILVAVPPGHILAEREAIYWTDLRAENVLLSSFDAGRELETLLMTKLVSNNRPKIDRHDVSRGIIKSLVSAGFGISLVTESDIGVSFSGLTYRDLQDGIGPTRMDYFAHWRKDNNNPALKNFIKLLGERYPLPANA